MKLSKNFLNKELQKVFPNRKIKFLTESAMSFTYEVGSHIVRIPRLTIFSEEYKKEHLIINHIQNQIKSVELPKMEIYYKPFFYTIHKKIPGYHWAGFEYIKKTKLEKEALANDCAIFFAELHGTDFSKIKYEIPEIKPLNREIEIYLSDDFKSDEINKLTKYIEELYTLKDKCLIHNDFYPPNFIIDDKFRLKAVIDFGKSQFNNFNFDFRKILSYEEGEKDFWKRIVIAYEKETNKKINIDIIRKIDIYNYLYLLTYFSANLNKKAKMFPILNKWSDHIQYIKNKLKKI